MRRVIAKRRADARRRGTPPPPWHTPPVARPARHGCAQAPGARAGGAGRPADATRRASRRHVTARRLCKQGL